jgi:hypothetical protein
MIFYKINTLHLQTLLFLLIFSYSAVKSGNLNYNNLNNQITLYTSTTTYNKKLNSNIKGD